MSSDLADAHVKALQALEGGSPSAALNLGNGRGFSVQEVVTVAEKVTGLTVPVIRGERRDGDPAALVSDASKARQMLGWQPRIPSEMVRTAWTWHQLAFKVGTASSNVRH